MRAFFAEMENDLQYFFLYRTAHASLDASVKFYQEELPLSEAFTASMTNALYLDWGMEARWEEMLTAYPSFAKFCDAWEKDKGKLEARADAALDASAKLYQEGMSREIFSEAMLMDIQTAALHGDDQPLREQIALPQGMPTLFPMPNWAQECREIVYARKVKGELELAAFGDDLQTVPTSAYIYYDYVSLEECKQYCEDLKRMGFVCYEKTYEDGSRMIMVMQGEDRFVIQWTPYETIVVLSDPMIGLISYLDYQVLTR